MKNVSNYKFYFKNTDDLTKNEKNEMMHLMIATYPAFKKYYLKNKYYSTVKPQFEHLIMVNKNLVGVGKLLWRKVRVDNRFIKFFAFGVLILKRHQSNGLGTILIKKDIVEAKKRRADILFGSTNNRMAESIVKKLGFKKINVPVFYTNTETGKIEKENHRVWIYEFKNGLINKIENLQKFYIGTGPL
ncbi:MAG: hypothetical protein HYV51_02395 [Parcubacteria group bacterium]|nr:hypothetical protein [Parcubacteria group bacterium]